MVFFFYKGCNRNPYLCSNDMPTNLHALIRYRTIDDCLRKTNRKWTWEDLSSACAHRIYEYEGTDALPSRRTIMYDIKHMRSGELGYEAPITYDRADGSYRYNDPDFSIQQFPLNREDVFELQYALSILKNMKGFKDTSGIENIITKLEHNVTLSEASDRQIIHFDHSLNEPGQRWLDSLYDHIKEKHVLKITYQPFYLDQAYHRTISPYLLKEYDKRWFLICWDHDREDLRNFALDRLLEVEKVLVRFRESPELDPNLYFKNIIGVTLPKKQTPVKVTFRVFGDDAKYLVTKPLHASQMVIKESDSWVDFGIQVIPNYELESVLLSFGDRLEVLKPSSLRKKFSERISLLKNRYQ